MGVREESVTAAVQFLQDPQVAGAPIEKQLEFLRLKNITQEEIDVALARVGRVVTTSAPSAQTPVSQTYRQAAPPYGYPQYQGAPFYPPPEPPRRDWRDYFIMATVMGGVGYGLYFVAKRYVVPLIAPPTPPQLEQDKSSIDEQFKRAFELIEQISADTAAVKSSEEQRKERLDIALNDIETTIQELKDASRRRDDDTRRIGDEVRNLQTMIPRAMDTQAKDADNRLKELNNELKSLKTLISNRMAPSNPATSSTIRPTPTANGTGTYSAQNVTNGMAATLPSTTSTTAPTESATSDSSKPSNPYARFGSGKGGIPAWQMAASKSEEKKDSSDGGAVIGAAESSANPS